MHKIYLFLAGKVLSGPNKLVWMLWFGSVNFGKVSYCVRGEGGGAALPLLTLMAALDVGCDIGIHVRPLVTLGSSFLGFLQTVMASQDETVDLLEDVGHKEMGQKENHSSGFIRMLDPFPDEAIFDK